MKANELRIGNYVKLMLNDEEYKIISIDVKDIELIENKQGVYEQIEITEEICDKLGCYYGMGGEPRFLAHDLSISIHFKNECVIIELGHGIIFIDYIEYVHQLQNLYFALTGEELVIKE